MIPSLELFTSGVGGEVRSMTSGAVYLRVESDNAGIVACSMSMSMMQLLIG